MQAQRFRCAIGVFLDVEVGQKHTSFPDAPRTEFVDVIPDKVHLPGLVIKQGTVFVFNAKFQGFGVHTGIIYRLVPLTTNRLTPMRLYPRPYWARLYAL